MSSCSSSSRASSINSLIAKTRKLATSNVSRHNAVQLIYSHATKLLNKIQQVVVRGYPLVCLVSSNIYACIHT